MESNREEQRTNGTSAYDCSRQKGRAPVNRNCGSRGTHSACIAAAVIRQFPWEHESSLLTVTNK
jgi:hypothetical protein